MSKIWIRGINPMAKMNWLRARKYSGYEEKYELGTKLSSGRVIGGDRSNLSVRADEILAYKKPVPQRVSSTKDWMALKAFVASAGLATETLGGAAGIKRAAADIYGVAVSSNMTTAIRAIPKKKRRALCKKYRKAHGLLSPKAKGRIRKAEMDSERMQAIQDQLRERE